MSLINVTILEFKLQAHPGNLAHDVPQPRERIEHVIWMERDTDEEDTDEEDGTGKYFAAMTPQAEANDALAVFLDYPWSLEIHRAEKDVADKKSSHCHRLILMEPEDEWLAPSHQLCNFSSHNLAPYKKIPSTSDKFMEKRGEIRKDLETVKTLLRGR